jgi:membrane protein YdbS with pleckstrin-like domain
MTTDELTPVHPDLVWVIRIRFAIQALALSLAAVVLDQSMLRETPVPSGLLPGAVFLLGLLIVAWLPPRRWRAWGYHEGADELDIRRGRLIRTRTVVPFGRVQHIDVSEGPVERNFGLATLILHTAGTRSAAVALPGLTRSEAEQMRDRIRLKIRQELL